VFNFRFAWTPGPWTVFAEVLNAFDNKGKDIAYFYTSRLPGEPEEGIDGRVSRAAEPFTIRAGLRWEL
jgi:hypothetical protein